MSVRVHEVSGRSSEFQKVARRVRHVYGRIREISRHFKSFQGFQMVFKFRKSIKVFGVEVKVRGSCGLYI